MTPLTLDKPTTIHLFDRLLGMEQMISRLSEIQLQSNSNIAQVKDALLQPLSTAANFTAETVDFPFTPAQLTLTTSTQDFPSLKESDMLIQFFLEGNEPFIRLSHVPFFNQQLREHRSGQSPLYFETVLPCIDALAMAALSSDFVHDFFGRSRNELLPTLRKKAEAALIKADFMRSQQPIVLRSLLYFITFLFEIGDNEYASSLVGVAWRAAFRIGLHRDRTDTSPFVRDARRRMWLHLQHLDNRAASLLGVESMMKTEWDTLAPKNASDETWEDYRTARESFDSEPPAVIGFTDTSFVLARAQIEMLQQQIRSASMTFEHMETYIGERQQDIWLRYVSDSGNKPLERFMVTLLEIQISAVYLTARQAHHKESSDNFRAQSFITAIELLERISAVEADMYYNQYSWALRAFVPIRAIVTVLTCMLFNSTPNCEARGWQQIGKIYARYDNVDCQLAKSSVFEPVNVLREQALQAKRQREMQLQP